MPLLLPGRWRRSEVRQYVSVELYLCPPLLVLLCLVWRGEPSELHERLCSSHVLCDAEVHVEQHVVCDLALAMFAVISFGFMPRALSISIRSIPFVTVGKRTLYIPYSSLVTLQLALKFMVVENTLLTTSWPLSFVVIILFGREVLCSYQDPLRSLYYEVSARVVWVLALACELLPCHVVRIAEIALYHNRHLSDECLPAASLFSIPLTTGT